MNEINRSVLAYLILMVLVVAALVRVEDQVRRVERDRIERAVALKEESIARAKVIREATHQTCVQQNKIRLILAGDNDEKKGTFDILSGAVETLGEAAVPPLREQTRRATRDLKKSLSELRPLDCSVVAEIRE